MKTFLPLILLTLLISCSIYIFLSKPAPQKYIDLIVEEKSLTQRNDPTKFLFVGDIMLDRGIRKIIDQNGFDYILKDISTIFSDKDIVIGNLEGTITANDSISAVNNQILHFTFATSTAIELERTGFDVVSLANNHTLDFYQAGFDETKNNLQKVGIFSFGHPLNNQSLSYQTKINDEDICLVGYHSLYNSTTTHVLNELSRLQSRCSYIVVFAHWGVEYKDPESDEQREQAHLFIDSGADLVIGAHPHVIQPIEIYKEKAIFYSLGNFIFDQDFSLKTRQGIALELDLGEEDQIFKIIPIEMYKGKLYFPEKDIFKSRIDVLISKLPPDLSGQIKQNNYFSIIR
jgi:gamma-polyglutamate biosynthesis protein CapA